MLNLYVVLVEPEQAGNIGFVARVMKNFGFKNLVLVNPRTRPDAIEAKIFASHAVDVLESALVVDSLSSLSSKLDFMIGTTSKVGGDYNVLRVPITPRELAHVLAEVSGNVGIVFGRESYGLTNDELRLCDLIVTIPASNEYPVLNVSHAVAIILYEIYTFLEKPSFKGFREASVVEKTVLVKYFNDFVNLLEYDPYKKEIVITVFKHIIGRAFISGREAHTLIGAFRKAVELLSSSNE